MKNSYFHVLFVKLVFVASFVVFLMMDSASGDFYRGAERIKLPNGISVVFFDTNKTRSVYITLCISVGKSTGKFGVAELLADVISRRLQAELNILSKSEAKSQEFAVEVVYYIGERHTLFSLLGNSVDFPKLIENLGSNFCDVNISDDDLQQAKKRLKDHLFKENQIDGHKLRVEAVRFLHLRSDNDVMETVDALDQVEMKDLLQFKDSNYTNDKITLLIGGKIDKTMAEDRVIAHFTNKTRVETSDNITIRKDKYSKQISVPLVEMYWKMPNYQQDAESALALEIFLLHLRKKLKQSYKSVHSIWIDYSLWDSAESNLKISFTTRSDACISTAENEVLDTVRRIATDISDASVDLSEARNELYCASNVFNYNSDIIDTMNWLSEKLSLGYDYDFLRHYSVSVKRSDLAKISKTAVELLKKDPDVISVLKPEVVNAL